MNDGDKTTSIHSELRREVLRWLGQTSTVEAPEFELLEWFLQETETQHAGMQAAEDQYIAEQQASGNPDVNDSGILAVKYYLRRVRYSQVIQLVSLLEDCLDTACENLRQIRKGKEALPFEVSDLKGNQWSVKRKFLERYLGIEVPDHLGAPVRAILCVRNIIVHNNGKVDALTPKERRKIDGMCHVGIDEESRLVLDPEFLRSALQDVRAYVACIDAGLATAAQQAMAPRPVT